MLGPWWGGAAEVGLGEQVTEEGVWPGLAQHRVRRLDL